MAVREVLKMGDPRLLQVAEPVAEFGTDELHALVTDMFDTMEDYNGAGLAAPQIGVSRRVVIFGIEENPRYPDAEWVPTTVLINPEIIVGSLKKEGDWEGCLSVPGLRGKVERYVSIRYRGYDQEGNLIDREVQGFHARVVQHECDHLDGILYPSRIGDMRNFGFEEVLFPDLAAASDEL
jgi:peptide deformylase